MKRLIKKARLPILDDLYNKLEYDYVDGGIERVKVDNIIGLTLGRVDEYNDNWTPKNPKESRWVYVYNAMKNGNHLPILRLIKTPDGTYFPNGDGNHRVAAAKVLGIPTLEAKVTIMVPKEEAINKQWEEYNQDKQERLDKLTQEYSEAIEESNKYWDKYGEDNVELQQKIDDIANEMSSLEEEINKEETEFKQNLLNKYLKK